MRALQDFFGSLRQSGCTRDSQIRKCDMEMTNNCADLLQPSKHIHNSQHSSLDGVVELGSLLCTMRRIALNRSCRREGVANFLSFATVVNLLVSSAAAWTYRSPSSIKARRHCGFMAETDEFDKIGEESFLKILLSPPKNCKVDQMSSTDLAYIGDSVYELFMRSRSVWPPKRTSDLQNQVIALVRGK